MILLDLYSPLYSDSVWHSAFSLSIIQTERKLKTNKKFIGIVEGIVHKFFSYVIKVFIERFVMINGLWADVDYKGYTIPIFSLANILPVYMW